MIQQEFLPVPRILVVQPDGSLSEDDFRTLGEAVDGYFDEPAGVHGLLIEAPSFPGWEDFHGFLAHMRFVKEHQKRLRRVALVTGGGILGVLPKFANLFVSAELKHFDTSEREAALDWLSE